MKRFCRDLKRYFKYAVYSAKAELKSEVANSYLNWIWWVLEPICLMLVYVFVFQFILKQKQPHFSNFVYIGLTAWTFFNKNVTASVKLVHSNKSIVSKVYIPKFILILSKMFVNGFKMLISFGIVILLMIAGRVTVTWHVIEIVPLVLLLWVFTYALSTVLLHLGVFIEDMQYVVTIVLRLLFYLTGIFFDISTKVEAPISIILGKLNPMAYIISQMRNCLIYETGTDWRFYAVWFVISIIISMIGTRIIYKNENSYVKVI